MELLCWISLLLTAIDTVESGGLGQGGGRGSGILEKKKSLNKLMIGKVIMNLVLNIIRVSNLLKQRKHFLNL